MQDRFDVGLMADVARGMPDAGFVLIGPVFTPGLFEPLRRLPNVFFTGRVHQTEVPALIKLFDVCIMPHVKDGLTAAMNPLKLYEYLAYGKPTVCTNAGDLEQFDGLIEIAGDAGEFRSKIEAALDEHPEKKRARIKFAGRQDWSKRVRSMVKEIDRKLFEKA
jgi:glycosyltransferase involved in cell wall biosynthesis